MIKKSITAALLSVAIILGSGIALAADDGKQDSKEEKAKVKAEEGQKQEVQRPDRPARRQRRSPRDARKMFYEQRLKQLEKELKERTTEHENFIKELEAIKELAKEEDATKTADQVDRLIGKMNRKFEGEIEVYKNRLEQFKKSMEQRLEGRRERPERGRNRQENEQSDGENKQKGRRMGSMKAPSQD
ncbi:hypothetical protein STSP2_00715 [Anaerohalosphaera lusitana]|uniref:Uncharacterized protein n=1 Tax=Anaerohalosphaera lusitana TaxID=1936003 RepID=A0A1U9NIF3_9BACT|nr:hypothetical protein [Anaerohalosphaera lusitana]AQT67567.1 hypothetical protein STSP2_00715 [Anaerohalosphaera lusitana]